MTLSAKQLAEIGLLLSMAFSIEMDVAFSAGFWVPSVPVIMSLPMSKSVLVSFSNLQLKRCCSSAIAQVEASPSHVHEPQPPPNLPLSSSLHMVAFGFSVQKSAMGLVSVFTVDVDPAPVPFGPLPPDSVVVVVVTDPLLLTVVLVVVVEPPDGAPPPVEVPLFVVVLGGF